MSSNYHILNWKSVILIKRYVKFLWCSVFQTHKRVWPSSQRDSLFWSTIRHCPSETEDGPDYWTVANHSMEHPSYPVSILGRSWEGGKVQISLIKITNDTCCLISFKISVSLCFIICDHFACVLLLIKNEGYFLLNIPFIIYSFSQEIW